MRETLDAIADGDIPVTLASIATVIDCGDMVWCLVLVDMPRVLGEVGDELTAPVEIERQPARWIAFPRAGFMVFALAAAQILPPHIRNPVPDWLVH